MSQEPLFWYRPRSDGVYEGPLHNGQIEDVRKASGAWVPLFAGAAPVSAEPVAVPKGWRLVPVSPTKEMLLAGETEEYDAELWWSLMLDAAPAAPVATPAPAFSVGVRGVGIIDDNPSALAVYFNAAPNDDDIRALHEIVSAAQVATTSPALAQGEARMNKGITRGKDGNLAQKDGPEVAAQSSAPAIPPEKPLPDLMMASYHEAIGWNECRKAMIAAQAQQPVSGTDGLADYPTHGINLGQRIAQVGGRENAQGYVEFGSPMAVHALIQHVLRDFHRQGRVNLAPAQQTTDPLQGAADWLVKDCGVSDPAGLANRLGIGYNRASRLVDAARKEQA